MIVKEILKKKVNDRTHDEKVFVAAIIIKQSWAGDEDAKERAEDAAYLIARREDWVGWDLEQVAKIQKEIMEYF